MKYTNQINQNEIEVHLVDKSYLNFEICIGKDELIFLYKEMLKMRKFEENASKNYDKMRGFLHLTIGQESIYSSILYCLLESKKNNNNDLLFDFIGSYRCHSLAYITGSTFQEISYELLGRKKGMCKGKGGSMHLYNKNFYGGHGIVGAQVSLGTGLAFAIKYAKNIIKNDKDCSDTLVTNLAKKKYVFAFFGDGAANQGQVYESYNMALLYKLPIIFVIENNRYGMYTSTNDVSTSDNFFSRWNEMRGIRIKSNHPLAILNIFQQIINKNELELPMVLQIDTYRFCGHSMKDDGSYRTEQEILKEKNNDCIAIIENIINQLGVQDEIDNIKEKIETEMQSCFVKASEDKLPGIEELFTDIYK